MYLHTKFDVLYALIELNNIPVYLFNSLYNGSSPGLNLTSHACIYLHTMLCRYMPTEHNILLYFVDGCPMTNVRLAFRPH